MTYNISADAVPSVSTQTTAATSGSQTQESNDCSIMLDENKPSNSTDEFQGKTQEQEELERLQKELEEVQKKIANTKDEDELKTLKAQESDLLAKIKDLSISAQGSKLQSKTDGATGSSGSSSTGSMWGMFPFPESTEQLISQMAAFMKNLIFGGGSSSILGGGGTPSVQSVQSVDSVDSVNPVNSDNSVQAPVTTTIDPQLAAALDRKLGAGFSAKVEQVSANINCNPNDLLGMMYSESGLNPKAYEPNYGASGLIQIMPNTAPSLGTTTAAIRNMSAIEQLDYVEKYFKMNKKMFLGSENAQLDGGTMYTLCFLPAFAKKEVLAVKGGRYYSPNAGLDINKDGQITKSDLSKRVSNKYQEMYNSFV